MSQTELQAYVTGQLGTNPFPWEVVNYQMQGSVITASIVPVLDPRWGLEELEFQVGYWTDLSEKDPLDKEKWNASFQTSTFSGISSLVGALITWSNKINSL